MRSPWLAVTLLPIALVLAACAGEDVAPGPPPTSAPTESATSSPAPPPAPTPDALVIAVDGLTLLNGDGSSAGTTSFADGAGTLAFLNDLLDAEPTVTRNPDGYEITSYDWGALSLSVIDGLGSQIVVRATEFEGLTLRTVEGVTVDDTRAEVASLGALDGGYDGDGDGASDFVQLSTRNVPGTDSLEKPGSVGVDYVMISFEGDDVVGIHAPANDYGDL